MKIEIAVAVIIKRKRNILPQIKLKESKNRKANSLRLLKTHLDRQKMMKRLRRQMKEAQ